MEAVPHQLGLFELRDIDAVEVSFSGKITLNLSDPRDVKLWDELRLGKEPVLGVRGTVRSKQYRVRADKEGYLSNTVGKAVINVEGAWLS